MQIAHRYRPNFVLLEGGALQGEIPSARGGTENERGKNKQGSFSSSQTYGSHESLLGSLSLSLSFGWLKRSRKKEGGNGGFFTLPSSSSLPIHAVVLYTYVYIVVVGIARHARGDSTDLNIFAGGRREGGRMLMHY